MKDRPDALLPVARSGVAVLLALAIANGAFLYLFPAQARAHYAWAIAPPVSAAFMGAGYLAGAVGTALTVFAARYWRSARGVVPGFCMLGVSLFAATMIHADRFRWGYPPTWGWTAVYLSLSPATIYLWRRQSKVAQDTPPSGRDRRLGPLPALSVALGLVLAAGAIALFIAPDGLRDAWPWPITPLISRVFAGWYFLAAGTLIFMGISVRRAHEIPIPYATIGAWSIFLLALPPLYSDTVKTGAGAFVPWLVTNVVLLALCAAAVIRGAGLMKADGQQL